MSYVDSNLVVGEQITYRAHLHWFVFLPWALVAVITRGYGVPLLLIPLIRYYTTEMAITNLRVIMKAGWISRRTFEMKRQQIETVSIDQSVVGRAFGYGVIVVTGTGGTKEPFRYVDKPFDFKKMVLGPTAAPTALLGGPS